jgi:uncharacterized protein (DUF305 family)
MTIRTFTLGAGALALSLVALPVAAQHNHGAGHGGMNHGTEEASAPRGDDSASSQAFAQANARMHEDMDITYTGDADVDFVRGMIAHHEGAIEMARIVLEHGEDKEIRKLAEEIIAAQEAEVATMNRWLEEHGG